MKKVIIMLCCLVGLYGCNFGSTSLAPDYSSGRWKFSDIEISKTEKSGRSCEISIPFLLIWKAPTGNEETSVVSIAKKSKIEKITYVDKHWDWVLPFFINECYTVYGY